MTIGKRKPASSASLLQGTLDLLLLQLVAVRPDHGLGLSRRLARATESVFEVGPGSLFPALHRLEERGWLASRWGESENHRRARFYELTRSGRRQLERERNAWERVAGAIGAALSLAES